MRVLALSGGGFKGAFQVPIIEHLIARNSYDLILGVSVGAINGALAAQNDIAVMKEFWHSIDCKTPIFGIPGFLSFAAHRGRGYYSLKPIRKHLEAHVSLEKLQVKFGAGVVARENGEYYTLYSDHMKTDKQFHDSIIASSAIAGLMEPMIMKVDESMPPMILCDGGHRNVLPDYPIETTHVDAVFCNPIVSERKSRSQVDRILEAIAWGMDIQMEAYAFADFERLKVLAEAGVLTANVYAPDTQVGSLLSADAETLKERMKQGKAAIKQPIRL